MVFYNDNVTAPWLRHLMAKGFLAQGDICSKDVREVKAEEVANHTEAHFFAGIGGWPLALRIALWPAKRGVWTASLPCQPFSNAGKRMGVQDDRHLWPCFFELIKKVQPPTLFGEQVAGVDGRNWLAGVRSDLEGAGYEFGAADLPAACVGAPHIRQRLFWVANRNSARTAFGKGQKRWGELSGNSARMAHPNSQVADAARSFSDPKADGRNHPEGSRQSLGLGLAHPDAKRLERRRILLKSEDQYPLGAGRLPWAGAKWHLCQDRKKRRIKSGILPLAHGIPDRMVAIKGYGNAIVPQVAALFIKASGA